MPVAIFREKGRKNGEKEREEFEIPAGWEIGKWKCREVRRDDTAVMAEDEALE